MSEKQLLGAKQEAFCREYLIDLNGKQAAIRAGYSAKTAAEQAARLLTYVSVRSLIDQLKMERAEKIGRTAEDVLRDIQSVKESCMATSRDQYGNEAMADAKAALKALELEGKHLKMFVDRIEHSGKIGLEALVTGE